MSLLWLRFRLLRATLDPWRLRRRVTMYREEAINAAVFLAEQEGYSDEWLQQRLEMIDDAAAPLRATRRRRARNQNTNTD